MLEKRMQSADKTHTIHGQISLTVPSLNQHLHKRRRPELLLPNTPLRIELPHLTSHIQYVRVTGHETLTRHRNFTYHEVRDAVQAFGVRRRRSRDVVEPRGDASVLGDEMGKVGKETGRFVVLDFAVFDGEPVEICQSR